MTTSDIGRRVREAREQRGLSLRDTAGLTKLSTAVLRAIEQNDFASLPGGVYRTAYLRTVAAEVGLDPLEIAADYKSQYEPPPESASVSAETATTSGRWVEGLRPLRRRAMVTVVAVAVLSVVWLALRPDPVSGTSWLQTPSPSELRVRQTSVDAERTVAVPNVQSDEPGVAPAVASGDHPLKVDLTTIGSCWVSAESDGERVVYGLMEPGKRLVVEGRRRISLRLGDAGAVQLSINDGPTRTAGADGEVLELEVTSDAVQTLGKGVMVDRSGLGDQGSSLAIADDGVVFERRAHL